jgi:hypothetical protein
VNQFGPEIENTPLKSRSYFRPYALGGRDAHSSSDHPPMYTLHSLMVQNGHSFIDILKIDIESGEFDALERFLADYAHADSLPIGQLQVEIHASSIPFARLLDWWEKLEGAGLRPFWTEPNLVYINIVEGAKPSLSEVGWRNIFLKLTVSLKLLLFSIRS